MIKISNFFIIQFVNELSTLLLHYLLMLLLDTKKIKQKIERIKLKQKYFKDKKISYLI